MPEQFNAGRPGKFKGVGLLSRANRTLAESEPFVSPGKYPRGYIYQRGFDDSFLLVTDALINVVTADETLVEVVSEPLGNTSTSLTSISESASENLASLGTATQSASEVALEPIASTSTNTASYAEKSVDSLTSTGTESQSLSDLLTLAESLTSSAQEVHSLAESAQEGLTSTETASEAVGDVLSDLLAQVATSTASLLETAQEGVQSVLGGSQGVSETASEVLTLLTSAVGNATFLEIDADVLMNTATNSGSISDSVAESLVQLAVAIQALNELVAEAMTSLSVAQESVADSGYTPPPMLTDDFSFSFVPLITLSDQIISNPTPIPFWRPAYGTVAGVQRKKSRDKIAVLERQAEVILDSTELPKSYSAGAKKAYQEFQNFYGSEEGRRIFIQKALEQGRGESIYAKIADVFKTGAKVDQTKKMKTNVQVLGKNGPNVSVSPLRGQGVTILRRG